MNARCLILTGTLLLLLAGCATLPQEARIQTRKDCTTTPSNCQVEVNGFTGLVPEHVDLPKNTASTIHWQIPQWSLLRFRDDGEGIVFTNAGGHIKCNPNPAENKRTVVCLNDGTPNDAGYKYWVHLNLFKYDPFVWNR